MRIGFRDNKINKKSKSFNQDFPTIKLNGLEIVNEQLFGASEHLEMNKINQLEARKVNEKVIQFPQPKYIGANARSDSGSSAFDVSMNLGLIKQTQVRIFQVWI